MTQVLTSKLTRWLAIPVAIALVLALMVGSEQPSAQAIGPGDTDIAYVADGYNFPDALMGATVAALNTAPMLGVRGPDGGDRVPQDTADELDRLTNNKANKLTTIFIFGGPAAVSDKVKADLGAWADNVERIFGDNRFGTMKAISEALPAKVKDSDLLDGKDSTEFATQGQLTHHWAASGSTGTVTTGPNATPGTAAAVCSTVDVPASGVLNIEGQVVLDNESTEPVQVLESTFSGARVQLPPNGSTGEAATLPVSTFTEVGADDDGSYCLTLHALDLTGDSDTEDVSYRGIMNITFIPEAQVEVSTP